jgi:chemotaxis response regulator CheB
MPVKVVVADESGTMRSAIVWVLKDNPDYEVVGEAASFAQTLLLTSR